MIITKWHSTTAISRANDNILDVIKIGNPSRVDYGPEELFPMIDAALTVDETDPNIVNTIQYLYLLGIWNQIDFKSSPDGASEEVRSSELSLRQLLAVPVVVFNVNTFKEGVVPDDRGTTATLGKSSYRVTPFNIVSHIS